MDGSSDDESYCDSSNLEEGKREDTEDYYGEVEEEEEREGSEDGEEQAWRIGHFKRFFPVKKRDTELPLASNKAYMEKRRPVWLPQFTVDENYFEQANYFSEVLAKDQLVKQAIFDKYYKSKLGEYAYSSGDLVCRKYLNKHMKGAHCVRFSPGGKYIVIGCGNGTIQINNMRNKTTSVHCLSGFQRRITSVRFLPGQAEGPFFASSLTGRVYLGKQENEEWNCYTLLKEINNEINAMDLNCDGSFMATAGMDSHIRIYDTNNKKLTQMYLRPGSLKEEKKETTTKVPDSCHFRRICALKYHPNDSSVFITGGWDDLIKLWDLRTPNKPNMTIPGPHLQSNSIDIMGNVLLTGQWTCKEGIQMWDMRTTRCLKTVEPTNRPLNCSGQFINDVQFLHSWEHGPITIPGTVGDLLIAAGTGTKAVEVISIKENLILYRVEETNAVVTVDHHKSYIVYGAVSHLYGIATFFPFAGELSRRMKFPGKNDEELTLKHYSISGNPMGWHEVAISLDFLDGVKEAEKVKEPDSVEGASGATEEVRGTAEKPARRGPGTYDIDFHKAYYKSLEHQNYYTTK